MELITCYGCHDMEKLSRKQKEILSAYLGDNTSIIAAYIFGSQANENEKSPNDVDLGILTNRVITIRELMRIRADICKLIDVQDLDIVILNEAPPVLQYEVISKGQPIISKDEDRAFEFERYVFLHYFDTQYLRQVQNNYLLEGC